MHPTGNHRVFHIRAGFQAVHQNLSRSAKKAFSDGGPSRNTPRLVELERLLFLLLLLPSFLLIL
jgi:hypothetical protein